MNGITQRQLTEAEWSKMRHHGPNRLADHLDNILDLKTSDACDQHIDSAYRDLGRAFVVHGPELLKRLEFYESELRWIKNRLPTVNAPLQSMFGEECNGCKAIINRATKALEKEELP